MQQSPKVTEQQQTVIILLQSSCLHLFFRSFVLGLFFMSADSSYVARLWLKLQFICQPFFFHQSLTPLIPIYVQLIHPSLLKNRHHPFIWQPSNRPQSHLSSYHLSPRSENKLFSSLILLSFLSLFCLLLWVTISLGYPHLSPVIHLGSLSFATTYLKMRHISLSFCYFNLFWLIQYPSNLLFPSQNALKNKLFITIYFT